MDPVTRVAGRFGDNALSGCFADVGVSAELQLLPISEAASLHCENRPNPASASRPARGTRAGAPHPGLTPPREPGSRSDVSCPCVNLHCCDRMSDVGCA